MVGGLCRRNAVRSCFIRRLLFQFDGRSCDQLYRLYRLVCMAAEYYKNLKAFLVRFRIRHIDRRRFLRVSASGIKSGHLFMVIPACATACICAVRRARRKHIHSRADGADVPFHQRKAEVAVTAAGAAYASCLRNGNGITPFSNGKERIADGYPYRRRTFAYGAQKRNQSSCLRSGRIAGEHRRRNADLLPQHRSDR